MNKKLSVLGLAFLCLISVGAGCANSSPQQESSNTASVLDDSSQEYVWVEQGISFRYPKGLLAVKGDGNDRVFIAESSATDEDINRALNTTGFPTGFFVSQNTTVDTEIGRISDNDLKSRVVEKIGEHTFTKIIVLDVFTGDTDTHYLLPFKGGVLRYKDGQYDKGDAVLTLSTLKF